MKLAIAGKGGVGKTTLASFLAGLYAAEGREVIAIDANPDTNLATALGIPAEEASRVIPIAELKDLIEERTGAKPGGPTTYFRLNPRVDDIPDRFSIARGKIKLMVMGTVRGGGTGCMCPESALLRALLTHLLLQKSQVVIMDMEAGLEHLGRGTAKAVDALLVVVEPGQRSLQTAQSVKKLARDTGIDNIYVVGSKIQNEADRQFIIDNLPGFEVLGFISYNPKIREADRLGLGVFDAVPEVAEEVEVIKERLDRIQQKEAAG